MPSARKLNPEERKNVVVIAAQKSSAVNDDHRSLPTLLQWVKKQPQDRSGEILYPVKLVFFAGVYPSHTLVTELFRARLNQSIVPYLSLVKAIQNAEETNMQLYCRVASGTSGDFEIVSANDEAQFNHTALRWIGSDDPFIGVALEYSTF